MIRGKETLQAIPDGLLEKLPRAMTMAKGPIPKSEWDSSVLGDLAPDKLSAGKSPFSSKGTAPNTPLHPAVSRPKGQQPPLAQEAARAAAERQEAGLRRKQLRGLRRGLPRRRRNAGRAATRPARATRGAPPARDDEKRCFLRNPAKKTLFTDASQNPPGPTQFAAGPVRQYKLRPRHGRGVTPKLLGCPHGSLRTEASVPLLFLGASDVIWFAPRGAVGFPELEQLLRPTDCQRDLAF